jgi:hypothetical protein
VAPARGRPLLPLPAGAALPRHRPHPGVQARGAAAGDAGRPRRQVRQGSGFSEAARRVAAQERLGSVPGRGAAARPSLVHAPLRPWERPASGRLPWISAPSFPSSPTPPGTTS